MISSSQCKPRRLWRLAVAPQPPIAEQTVSAVSRGDTYSSETHCKLRRSVAVGRADSFSHSLGSAKRDRLSSSTSYGKRQSPSGELTIFRWRSLMYPQLRCFAACSGFHDIGPAPRNPQLILNLLAFVGAWLRRDAIASYVSLVCCNSK